MTIKSIYILLFFMLCLSNDIFVMNAIPSYKEACDNTSHVEPHPPTEPHPSFDQPKTELSPQEMLYGAIMNDSSEEAERCIRLGADVNRDKAGKPLVFWAAKFKKHNALNTLLGHGAFADKKSAEQALRDSDFKSALLIVDKKGMDINDDYSPCGNNVLQMSIADHAVRFGDMETAILLAQRGAKFKCPEFKERAIGNLRGKTDATLRLFQEMINRGSDINNFWFIGKGKRLVGTYKITPFINFMIRNRANVDYVFRDVGHSECFSTPLFEAIMDDSLEAVDLLVRAGANINQKAKPFVGFPLQTPLAFALSKGSNQMLQLLISNGATS